MLNFVIFHQKPVFFVTTASFCHFISFRQKQNPLEPSDDNFRTVADIVMKFLCHFAMVKSSAKFEHRPASQLVCFDLTVCWLLYSLTDIVVYMTFNASAFVCHFTFHKLACCFSRDMNSIIASCHLHYNELYCQHLFNIFVKKADFIASSVLASV